MTSRPPLQLDVTNGIATCTIDRPHAANALDRPTIDAFARMLVTLARRPSVGVLIITGAGESVFAAGGDLREIRGRRVADALEAAMSSLCRAVETFPKPTIAAVNGHALGGGCELALACDLRLASADAQFGQPEVRLGLIPAAGGTQRLSRVIGLGRAKHMVLTGDPIDASTALAWGLVSAVVPSQELRAAAAALAERLAQRSPLALQIAKLALNGAGDATAGLLLETLGQAICYDSPDKEEGIDAFLERRAPQFTRRGSAAGADGADGGS